MKNIVSKVMSTVLAAAMLLTSLAAPVSAKSTKSRALKASTSINPADLSDWVVYDHYYVPQGNTSAIYKANSTMPNRIDDFDSDHPFFYHKESQTSGSQYKTDISDLSRTHDFNHHIWTSGSGSGATVTMVGYSDKAYKDFILYPSTSNGLKTLSFDFDPAKIDTHTISAMAILINASVTGGNLKGSVIYYRFSDKGVYLLSNVNVPVESLHNGGTELPVGSGTKLGTFTQTRMRIDMEVDSTSLKLKQTPYSGGDLGTPVNFSAALTDTGNYGFGFMADYASHGCTSLSYIKVANLILTEGYSVIYNPNIPDGDPDPLLTEANPNRVDGLDPGATVGALPTPPTRKNYEFNYWSTNPAGGAGTEFGANTPVNSTMILYAQWVREPLPVTYHAGAGGKLQKGSEALTDTVVYEKAGKDLPLNRQAPAPTPVADQGYRFVNWTNKTGAAIDPSSDNELVNANNQDITANFTKETYAVTYNAGEGTFSDGGKTAMESVLFQEHPQSIPAVTPPDHKVHVGWKAGQDETLITDLSQVQVMGETTYTAVFEWEGYDVTFMVNDPARGSLDGTTKFTGVKYGAPLPEFPTPRANAGFAFDRWQDKNGNEIPTPRPAMDEPYSTITAVFEADENGDGTPDNHQKRVQIQFVVAESGGGTLVGTTQYVAIGAGIKNLTDKNVVVGTFAVPEPKANEGYRFAGWDSQDYQVDFENDTQITYTATFKMSAGVTFTASEGGKLSGKTSYPDAVVGDAFPARPTVTPDQGFMFEKWVLSDGTELAKDAAFPEVTQENRTVTAQFAEDENGNGIPDYKESFTVSYATDESGLGSLSGQASETVGYGKNPAHVPTPVFDAGTTEFKGWVLKGAGTSVTPGSYRVTSDVSFTAKFARITAGVKFVVGEHGSHTGGQLDYPNAGLGDSLPPFPSVTPDSGYMFAGWFDAAGNQVQQGGQVTRDTVTISAVFKQDLNGDGKPDEDQHVYKVSFKSGPNGKLVPGSAEYLAIGDDPVLTVSDIVGAYTKPTPVADAGCTFKGWSPYDPEANNLRLTGNTVFTASFSADLNGDGVPDEDQNVYRITFEAGQGGKLSGKTEFTAIGGHKGDGVPLDLNTAGVVVGGFAEPGILPNSGYTIKSQWNPADFTRITGDTHFRAEFSSDLDGDGIPDEEQTVYTIRFTSGANGRLEGKTEFTAIGGSRGDRNAVLTAADVVGGYSVPNPLANTGYEFAGWTPSNPAQLSLTGSITFTANFKQAYATRFTVKVVTNSGTSTMEVLSGETVYSRLPKDGSISGWARSDGKSAKDAVTQNVTFTAVYDEPVKPDEPAPAPPPPPTRPGRR